MSNEDLIAAIDSRFASHAAEIREVTSRNLQPPKRDIWKIISPTVAILAVAWAGATTLFVTSTAADAAHDKIVATIHRVELAMKDKADEKHGHRE